MYERPTPKGKEKCPKCVGGFVAGNPNGTPMEALPSVCAACKGKGYKKK